MVKEESCGNIVYTLNGRYHREDGPAVEREDGKKRWYVKGKSYSEKNFTERFVTGKPMTKAELEERIGFKVIITD